MININFVLFPGLTQLDLTGPYEVLVRMPGAVIRFVAKDMTPVVSDRGLILNPTTTIDNARPCDLLVVPGGPGTDATLTDPAWISFVQEQAKTAKYIFGVCTGSLLLGAAGLLIGKRATCHWQARNFLAHFGAIVDHSRMVVDGNIFTAGGVTSGIDMALKVVATLASEAVAKQIQLQIEYDPAPPFVGGTPHTSDSATVEACMLASRARILSREQSVIRAAQQLTGTGTSP
jgi:cyclohexyl-isocyanide hydratase